MSELGLYILLFFIISITIFCLYNIKRFCLLKNYKQKAINYFILLSLSTTFVIINWNKCVRFELFSFFNGYNVIFILWLVLLALSVVKVNAFGVESFDVEAEKEDVLEEISELKKQKIEESKIITEKQPNSIKNKTSDYDIEKDFSLLRDIYKSSFTGEVFNTPSNNGGKNVR